MKVILAGNYQQARQFQRHFRDFVIYEDPRSVLGGRVTHLALVGTYRDRDDYYDARQTIHAHAQDPAGVELVAVLP